MEDKTFDNGLNTSKSSFCENLKHSINAITYKFKFYP